MRRFMLPGMLVLSVLLLGATAIFYTKYRSSEASFVEMRNEEERTRLRYGRAINEIAAIQDSLNTIALGEDEARMLPQQLQAEMRLSETRGDEALARVAVLKAGIERTKQRIQELDDDLKKSGVRIAGLERMIAGLRRTVVQKEELIAELTTKVDTLQYQVAGLSRELGVVYYTIGTRKDLMSTGVVEAKGGVLGLGKTLEPSGHVDESAFLALDTDQQDVIRIPSDRAQVLSAQPVTSYVLQPLGEDMMELRILDPKEFRKVKHLVILMA